LRSLDQAQLDRDGTDRDLGVVRDVDGHVALQPLTRVDGAVRRSEIADHDLSVADVDGGVELRDVRTIDVEVVELVAPDANGGPVRTSRRSSDSLGCRPPGRRAPPAWPGSLAERPICLANPQRTEPTKPRGALGVFLAVAPTWCDAAPQHECPAQDPAVGVGS